MEPGCADCGGTGVTDADFGNMSGYSKLGKVGAEGGGGVLYWQGGVRFRGMDM
jgi:hypothetical protein